MDAGCLKSFMGTKVLYPFRSFGVFVEKLARMAKDRDKDKKQARRIGCTYSNSEFSFRSGQISLFFYLIQVCA